MLAVIEPHYAPGRRGRKPFSLDSMLRAHVVQIVYNYSDPGMPKGHKWKTRCTRLNRCGAFAAFAWKRCRMKARSCSFGIYWNSTD